MAIKQDRSLWAWGNNLSGQLGLGNSGNSTGKNEPTKVGPHSDWIAVSAKSSHTVAIRDDSSLWAWGYNYYGQLGIGSSTLHATPVQVGTDTDWKMASIGKGHTVALRDDGTVWTWGFNSIGQLGLGNNGNGMTGDGTDRDIPTKTADPDYIKAFTVTVRNMLPPEITTPSLPNGIVNTAYKQTLTATGDPTITWSIYGGNLPTGLTLSADGTISGTPTAFGTFTFTVKAENGAGNDIAELTILIALLPTITTTSLQNGIFDIEYEYTLNATGYPAITWSIYGGSLPDGLTLSADGTIFGKPREKDIFTFTVKAENSAGHDIADLFLFIALPPTITTSSLPNGTVGDKYEQTLTATGDPTITWSIYGGTFPSGLTLLADGTIFGTPTENGEFAFTVMATNNAGNDTADLIILITLSPSITTSSLPKGAVGAKYEQTLTATGDPIITWSIIDGDLPDGLTLSAEGVISGAPKENGKFVFTVKAENDAGNNKVELSLFVALPPKITTSSLPNGIVGTAYEQTLTATGDPTITWSLIAGNLPGGLILSAEGVIAGTPIENGEFTFTVKAENDAGDDRIELVDFIALSPSITTSSLPKGAVGAEYEQTLTATGDPTITWSLIDGDLPDGLTLSADGTISGTPTASGTFTFTVKAENGAGSNTLELSIVIVPAAGGTAWIPGLIAAVMLAFGFFMLMLILWRRRDDEEEE
jgi:plastocyanin domain-containing protein